MQDTTTTRPAPPTFITDDDVTAADARLCAALENVGAWAETYGDRGSRDRSALWQGYYIAHELMLAFCAVDGAAFGGGR